MAALQEMIRQDPRYPLDAYLFVRDALDLAVRLYEKPDAGQAHHVSGQELLEAIRQHALREYGPMAFSVLRAWGIRATDDFGEIVFNMVERGLLGKTEEDTKEDFSGVYAFHDAFEKPYLPTGRSAVRKRKSRRTPENPAGSP